MADEFSFDVFLSHSSRDKDLIRELAERLQRDGLRVWFDQWEIQPGDSIPSKIEAGLEHSRVLVLCMSANAFGSDWSQLESGTFRFRDPLNKERRFIPLRLDDAPIKGFLSQFHHINWLPADREQAYPKLMEAVVGEKPPTPVEIKSKSCSLYELRFNSPLASPAWKLVYPDRPIIPKYRVIPAIGEQPESLEIDLPDGNPIDHDMPHEHKPKKVVIVAKYTGTSVVYLKFSGSDKGNRVERELWLCIERGEPHTQKHSTLPREWTIWFRPKLSAGGWETITVPLPKAFKETFEKDGYSFVSVNGIRFRGKITMARITMS